MKPSVLSPGCVRIVVNYSAIDAAPFLPDEKIHRFHLARYELVLVQEQTQTAVPG